MISQEKIVTEQLKKHLVSLGVEYEDVDSIITDYSNFLKKKYFKAGWNGFKRVNNQARILRREKTIEELEEFIHKYIDKLPVQENDVLDDFVSFVYNHLPIIK